MKKRIISILICLFSIVMLSSCGKKNDSNTLTGDEDVEELKAIIEEQQKEIDSLKDKNDKADKSKKAEAKIETYDDDEIIAFTDKDLQEDVRDLLGVKDANITYGMVKDVKSFGEGRVNAYSDITSLKYFTGLEYLSIYFNGKDISPLSNLQNLESLFLFAGDLTDISPIANLHNLRELDILASEVSDISALSNLSELESLDISQNPITDLEDIKHLEKLKEITIGPVVDVDISALEELPNLEEVTLSYPSSFSGDPSEHIEVLGNLKNLKRLRIFVELDSSMQLDLSPLKNLNMDNLESVDISSKSLSIYSVEDLNRYLQSPDSFNKPETEITEENTEYNPPTLYYVEVTAPDGYVNMRVEPGTDYEIITEINNGEVLAVVGVVDDGKWIKVEYNGSYGWVAASQVTEQ